MNEEHSHALQILLRERESIASSVPEDLIQTILSIEGRVQFDEERREAVQKIGRAVQASLDKESLRGPSNEHAS